MGIFKSIEKSKFIKHTKPADADPELDAAIAAFVEADKRARRREARKAERHAGRSRLKAHIRNSWEELIFDTKIGAVLAGATLFVILLLSLTAHTKPLDQECISYGDAKAIYDEKMEALEPSDAFGTISENLFGPSKEVEDARDKADMFLYLAYKQAYRGPHGTEEHYTAMLIAEDVARCKIDSIVSDLEWMDGIELGSDIEDEESLFEILEPLGLIADE